ncbi:MAG: hypothetical protein EXR98_11095 [Gemmataceae bacterium]|nr:hypothetical protein [Gemmataceae bacterium]
MTEGLWLAGMLFANMWVGANLGETREAENQTAPAPNELRITNPPAYHAVAATDDKANSTRQIALAKYADPPAALMPRITQSSACGYAVSANASAGQQIQLDVVLAYIDPAASRLPSSTPPTSCRERSAFGPSTRRT